MDAATQPAENQAALWNAASGCAWVELQELIDLVFKPLEDLLVEAVLERSGRYVLDVGCGTGGTTLGVARSLGARGRCVGIDISEPMIAVARARTANEGLPADFICADAQSHSFDPAQFDTIISRFGVMFFDDFVRAFANLRRAAREGAELRLLVWRGAEDNPFMTTAERAAALLLPALPPRRSDAPGQFAFADRARVRGILEQSGWADIDIRPLDVVCAFPEKWLVPYFTRFGPLGRLLDDADEQTRDCVVAAVRPAFAPYVHGEEVRFNAACWMIGARSLGEASEP